MKVERRFHKCTDIKCPLCLSKMWTPFGPFWPFLIGCMVSANYWLADYPEMRWTTQPSTIGGPLGESGFYMFCSIAIPWQLMPWLLTVPGVCGKTSTGMVQTILHIWSMGPSLLWKIGRNDRKCKFSFIFSQKTKGEVIFSWTKMELTLLIINARPFLGWNYLNLKKHSLNGFHWSVVNHQSKFHTRA